MNTRQVRRVDRFWFATAQRADGQWVAWAQTTPIYSDLPLPDSQERIWMKVGFSRENAAAQLKKELALPPYDAATIRQRRQCTRMLLTASAMLVGGMLASEPTLTLGGIVGIGHGLHRYAMLFDQTDDIAA